MVALASVSVWSLLLMLGCGVGSDDPPADPQAELDSAIEYFIKVCKDEDYEVLIFKCIHPLQTSEVLEEKSREQLVEGFKEKRIARIWAEVFTKAKGVKPEFREGRGKDTKEAIFKLSKPVEGLDEAEFILREGKWYISAR